MDSNTPPLADALTEIVTTRRSVRKFLPEPIPEDVVRACIDLAVLAPNSSNLQAWEFVWVRDPEKKKALAHICLDQQAAATAQELIAVVARPGKWRAHCKAVLTEYESKGKVPKIARDYYTKIAPIMYTQGLVGEIGLVKWFLATAVGLFRPIPREPVSHFGMKVWAVKTASLAAENLMLAFRAYGYDTCPMEGFDSARARRLLKIPRGGSIPMIVAAGKRAAGGVYGERYRVPIGDVLREI